MFSNNMPRGFRITVISALAATEPEGIASIRDGLSGKCASLLAAIFAIFCSVNAVTKSGKLVMIDGRGNRVGAICDGPKEVYFVVSENKVVDGGIDAAIARIKKEAVPPNCRRLGLKTPCAETGKCGGKNCKDPSCRLTVVVDAVPRLRKMTVIFTEEKLGF